MEEYFELEERAIYKNQYINGRVIPIKDDNTFTHNQLTSTVAYLFLVHIDDLDNGIDFFGTSQQIYISKLNQVVYSDGFVVENMKTYNNGDYAITNPKLIIEVLSDFTEDYNRGIKFKKHQHLESFQEYVLIDQHTPVIDILTKEKEGWLMKTYIGWFFDNFCHECTNYLYSFIYSLKISAFVAKLISQIMFWQKLSKNPLV